jgi:hypothetical protein
VDQNLKKNHSLSLEEDNTGWRIPMEEDYYFEAFLRTMPSKEE